jgi:hypothetical protein
MNVYLLQTDIEYEAPIVHGIFSSLEKAKEAAKQITDRYDADYQRKGEWKDSKYGSSSYWINRHEPSLWINRWDVDSAELD